MIAIDPRLQTYDWEHIFEGGQHYTRPAHVRTRMVGDKTYPRSDVAEIIAIEDGENDGDAWVGVFRMADGVFMAVRACCDYTGWGCQEGGSSDVADTLDDIVTLGLTQEERTRLAAQLTEVSRIAEEGT